MNPVRNCWCPLGIRPIVPNQLIREYFYVFSFVCPELGLLLSLILPSCDMKMMSIFLNYISKRLKSYFIIIQVDRALWHTSRKLKIPSNIRLIPQPKGSPELNPVEHIWEEIREKDLYNRGFDSISEEQDIVCDSLQRLSSNKEKVKSMTNFPHLIVDI